MLPVRRLAGPSGERDRAGPSRNPASWQVASIQARLLQTGGLSGAARWAAFRSSAAAPQSFRSRWRDARKRKAIKSSGCRRRCSDRSARASSIRPRRWRIEARRTRPGPPSGWRRIASE